MVGFCASGRSFLLGNQRQATRGTLGQQAVVPRRATARLREIRATIMPFLVFCTRFWLNKIHHPQTSRAKRCTAVPPLGGALDIRLVWVAANGRTMPHPDPGRARTRQAVKGQREPGWGRHSCLPSYPPHGQTGTSAPPCPSPTGMGLPYYCHAISRLLYKTLPHPDSQSTDLQSKAMCHDSPI